MDFSSNGEGLAETSVGISTYANNAPGFEGIMKQRYSDFVVREVGIDGKVTALENISPAALETMHFQKNVVPLTELENGTNEILVENVISEISTITGGKFGGPSDPVVPSETSEEELRAFLFSCIEKSEDCPALIIACPCPDKPTRTKLHQMVRKYLANYIESEALEVSSGKYIQLRAKHKMEKGTSGDWRSRNKWPENLGDYLQFTLFKENIDTMSAAFVLSKLLNCRVESVQYAGTKDKRAITSQKVTMYRRKPSELTKLNAHFLPPYIRVGDFEYVNEPLKLGNLSGNNFGIIMRDIAASSDDIKSACQMIAESGFVNFFGLQRFGSGGTKSHISGIALFKQDWKLAVDHLFAARDGDRFEMIELKAEYFKKDYKAALKATPYKMPAERSVLESLIREPLDFGRAYNCIPKNQWLICLHAYQSYIFNMAASERIRKYGMVCVEGDLVPIGETMKMLESVVEDIIEGDDNNASESIIVGGSISIDVEGEQKEKEKEKGNVQDKDKDSSGDKKKSLVHLVTADDVRAGTYTIRDVILPLPGHEIILPTNSIGQFITDSLQKDGFSIEFFATCQPTSHRMNGTYRKLIQMPANFEWNFFEYSDPNEELVPTEASYLRKMKLEKTTKRNDKKNSEIPIEFSTESKPYALTNLSSFTHTEIPGKYGPGDGDEAEEVIVVKKSTESKFKGLQLKFTLPPGTYATMMIREITKHSTSSQYQTQLTATAAMTYSTNTNVIDNVIDNVEVNVEVDVVVNGDGSSDLPADLISERNEETLLSEEGPTKKSRIE